MKISVVTQPPAVSTRFGFIKARIENVLSSLQALVAPPPQPLSKTQEDDLKATKERIEWWREKSFSFADVLFKAVSWTLVTGVVIGFWRATGYFPFAVLWVVMVVSFVVFVVSRGFLPLIKATAFFAKRTVHFGAWPIAIVLGVFIFCVVAIPLLVFPVAVTKATFALHCAPTDHDPARRPADCPPRPRLRLPTPPAR